MTRHLAMSLKSDDITRGDPDSNIILNRTAISSTDLGDPRASGTGGAIT